MTSAHTKLCDIIGSGDRDRIKSLARKISELGDLHDMVDRLGDCADAAGLMVFVPSRSAVRDGTERFSDFLMQDEFRNDPLPAASEVARLMSEMMTAAAGDNKISDVAAKGVPQSETGSMMAPEDDVPFPDTHDDHWAAETGKEQIADGVFESNGIYFFTIASKSDEHLSVIDDEAWLRGQVSFPDANASADERSKWISGHAWMDHAPVLRVAELELDVLNVRAEIEMDPESVLSGLPALRSTTSSVSNGAASWMERCASDLVSQGTASKATQEAIYEALSIVVPYASMDTRHLLSDARVSLGLTERAVATIDRTMRLCRHIKEDNPLQTNGAEQNPGGDFAGDREISDQDVANRILFRSVVLHEDVATACMETLLDLRFAIAFELGQISDYASFCEEFEANPLARIRPVSEEITASV